MNAHLHPMFRETLNNFARLSAESPEDRLAKVTPEETRPAVERTLKEKWQECACGRPSGGYKFCYECAKEAYQNGAI